MQTFGLIRVPLFTMEDGKRGFPLYLANKFAGNAKDQMISTLRQRKVVPDDHLDKAIAASEELMKQKDSLNLSKFICNSWF